MLQKEATWLWGRKQRQSPVNGSLKGAKSMRIIECKKSCFCAKRIFDVAAATLLIVCVSWLLPLIWLLLRISSGHQPIFVQRRVGGEQRLFDCYKFRTMLMGTPDAGTHEVSSDSVTPIGKFLRKTKIDELPQLVNVLRGDMSLVGPRPCLPSQHAVIEARILNDVFSVRPGITGLAQIRGIDMSTVKKLAAVDAEYIETQSFFNDIKILVLTFFGNGLGDNTCLAVKSTLDPKVGRKSKQTKSCQENE